MAFSRRHEEDTIESPDPTITWALLLARWTSFARESVGLPKVGLGGRMRESVPSIISLQAVSFALSELGKLPNSEWAVGLDRGGSLIRRDSDALKYIWAGHEIHPEISFLIEDAESALAAAEAALSPGPD